MSMRNCDYSKSNVISHAYDYDVFGQPLQDRPRKRSMLPLIKKKCLFTSGRMLGLTARWICESCRNLCSVLYWPHGRAILADWHSGL